MSDIGERAFNSFMSSVVMHTNNTSVEYVDYILTMKLFGNEIVRKYPDGNIEVSSGGHSPTRTTLERLSYFVPNLKINNGQFKVGEKVWDGNWINANDLNDGAY